MKKNVSFLAIQKYDLVIPICFQSVEKSSSFEYADVWSSRYTWGETGLKPVDKDLVLVPEGQTLLLDVDTPLLSMLLIQGVVELST